MASKAFIRKEVWGLNDEQIDAIDDQRLKERQFDESIEAAAGGAAEGSEGGEDLFGGGGGGDTGGGEEGGPEGGEEPESGAEPPEQNAGEEPEEEVDPDTQLHEVSPVVGARSSHRGRRRCCTGGAIRTCSTPGSST